MKGSRFLLFYLLFSLYSSSIFGQVCTISNLPTNLQYGLVAYYPFCGNSNDISGNGNTLQAFGLTATTDRFNTSASAYSFSNTQTNVTSYLKATNPTPFAKNTYTISAWFNSNQFYPTIGGVTYNYQSIVGYAPQHYAWGPAYSLQLLHADNTTLAASQWTSTNTFQGVRTNTGAISVNTWYHAVVTYDGTTLKMYKDGVLVGSTAATIDYANQVQFLIGANGDGPSPGSLYGGFNGKLDDIGFWERALDVCEVAQLYNLSAANPTPPIPYITGLSSTSTWRLLSTNTHNFSSAWSETLAATDPNKSYKLVVTGTWGIANWVQHRDAAFDGINTTPGINQGCDANWTFNSACHPPMPSSTFSYNPSHTYEYIINGQSGGHIIGFTDGGYGDNSGSLTFRLYVNDGAASICQGGATILTSSINSNNQWFKDGVAITTNGNNPTLTITEAGNYTLKQVTGAGCSSLVSNSIVAGTISATVFNPLQDTTTFAGKQKLLDAGVGYTSYTWSTGATSSTITATSNNTFKVTVVDNNGCVSTDSTFLNLLNINIFNNDSTICKGDSVILRSSSYSIGKDLPAQLNNFTNLTDFENNGQGSASVTNDGVTGYGLTLIRPAVIRTLKQDYSYGTYEIDAKAAGNTANQYFNLLGQNADINNASPLIVVDSRPSATDDVGWGFYYNGILVASANGSHPATYPNWYHIKVRYTPDSLRLWIDNTLLYEIANPVLPSNPTGSVIISSFATSKYDNFKYTPYVYNKSVLWSTGETTENIIVKPTTPTKYTVTVSNGYATIKDSVTLNVNEITGFDPLEDTTKVSGKQAVLNAGSGFVSYVWSTGASSSTITATSTNKYKVTVVDNNGCSTSDSTYLSLVYANILNNDTLICKNAGITLSIDSNLISYNKWQKRLAGREIYNIKKDLFGNLYALPSLNSNKIYKSTDRGETWVQLSSFPNLSGYNFMALGVDASNNIYASTNNNGMYRSVDNGNTWTNVQNFGSGCGPMDIVFTTATGSVLTVKGANRGIWYSSNSGSGWIKKLGGFDPPSVTKDIYGNIFASGFYKSIDSGLNWTSLSNSYDGYIVRADSVGNVYTINGLINSPLYKSINQGTTFTNVHPLNFSTTGTALPSDILFTKNLMFVAKGQIFYSANGGVKFSQIDTLFYGTANPSNYYSNPTFRMEILGNRLFVATTDGIQFIDINEQPLKVLWSTGDTTNTISVFPNSNTTYTVTVTDGISSASDQVVVTVPDDPTITASGSTTICPGGNVELTSSASVGNTWYKNGQPITPGGNGQQITVTEVGVYSLTATSTIYNCVNTSSNSITVAFHTLPTIGINSIPVNGQVCLGDQITLSGTGGQTYSWTGGVTDGTAFTPIQTGTYTVTGTDQNGCENSYSKNIVVLAASNVSVSAIPASAIVCANQWVTLNATGAVSYTWNNGVVNGQRFNTTNTTTFTVIGVDENGCRDTATKTIQVLQIPEVIINKTPITGIICFNDQVTLNATGAVNYVWNKGIVNGQSFNLPATNTYTVIGTAANGCKDTVSTTIRVNPLPNIKANASKLTLCDGESTILSGSGGLTYTWSNDVIDSVAFVPTNINKYFVTGLDVNGCENKDSIVLNLNVSPVVTVDNSVVCEGTPAVLNANVTSGSVNDFNFNWYSPNNLKLPYNANTITVTAGGIYSVQVVNKLSFCESSPTQVLVAFKSLPTIGPINSTTNSIFVDDKIVLIGNPIASNPPLTYTWFVSDPSKATITNDKEAVLKAISKGKVDISYHVTDINGCSSLESPILPFTISQISRFVIPSAFSPNNDGLNDYLNILLYPASLEIKYFKVFNRQGALVYETNRIGQGWDGRVNGMMQEADIYFWIAEFITDDGETVKKTGQTVLVK